jgi:GNAT superfamily N-acetyltransferase
MNMVKKARNPRVKIRRARISDAQRLAELSAELGYPAAAGEVRDRVRALKSARANAVFVAESSEAGVVGWAHVSATPLIEAQTRAELHGLIVAEGQRSLGAGALLLETVENWARQQGCRNMSVRSNVIRERAHRFYERQGYEHYKTQKAFRKAL